MRRLAALLLLVLAAPALAAKSATVTVLYTSDMHAHVLPVDDVRERPADGSVAQVATLVARLRAANPRTVVLDGGDAIQGTPLGYYGIAAPASPGFDPTIAAMNLVGYDAAVLGNHEFNFGLAVLRRSLGQSRFPWLAAGLGGVAEAKLPVTDELVLERGGVRIAILGLTNPNIPNWDPPSHWRPLEFPDPIEVARARVPRLRERADVVVVVAHTGFERDLDTGEENDTGFENFGWRLAQLPGIDVLLTGHAHRNVPPRLVGTTVVAQPGRWADTVTRIDLRVEKHGRRWKVVGWEGTNLKTAGETADERVLAAVGDLHARTLAELSRPLGMLAVPLPIGGVPTADDASVDLIHAVQLEASGARLSLAAPLAAGRAETPAGPLTPRLAHRLYPYPNTLVVVRLTGVQLKDVLEHAVRGWVGMDCAKLPCTLLRDPRLPSYNYDTLEGASYLVDPMAPVGSRVRGLRIGNRPVAATDTLEVVINSYRAAGGGVFPHLADAPRVREIDRPMVELLVDHLANHGTITPVATDNWAFAPPLLESVAPAAPATAHP
jgi:2',3'-cyclic-nucleotide 2'-phosphodiesterase (5'-nucleotidase family)